MSSPSTDVAAGDAGESQGHETVLPGESSLPTRALIFGSVVLGVILIASWFVGGTWCHFWGSSGLTASVALTLLTVSFVPSTLLSFRYQHLLLRAVNTAAAISLGFLSSGVIAAGACWILFVTATMVGMTIDPRWLATVLYGSAVLFTVYGIANARWLRTTQVTVSLPNLPESWENARVALVSDIHVGNIRGRNFVRRIISRLRRLEPDVVLIAGDMFDGGKVDLEGATEPWSRLSVRDGIYFVTGNHDEFSDRAGILAALKRAGVRVLDNEKVDVRGLQILGVHDGEAGNPRLFQNVLREANLDGTRVSILLTHQPAALAIPEAAGISLQVSGHTHGGQFWPWNWAAARVHGRFTYGLNRFGKMLVYTSSGAGTWGPPLRIGTCSEIVLIQLKRAG